MQKNDNIDSENNKPGNALDVGGTVRVARLDDLKRIRAEIGRLYREARRREGRFPDALTAMRLATVLSHVRTTVELESIEQRLRALEERATNDRK